MIFVILIHNLEEWLTFPHYAESITNTLTVRFGKGINLPDWPVMELALVLSALLPSAIIAWTSLDQQTQAKNLIASIVAGIFFANVFFPHLPAAIVMGGYTPGLISALAIVLPFCVWFWRQALREKILSVRQTLATALLGAIILPPSILIILLASEFLVKLSY